MASEPFIRGCRNGYAKLLRLYPKAYRERFGEGMEQTFNDLCRERRDAGKGLFGFVLWIFAETFAGIIKENTTFMIMQYKRIIRIGIGVGLILMVPLIGMQVSDEWNWSLFDFIFIGALLFGAGLAYELLVRNANTVAYRIAVGIALGAALLLVWVNGAVEIIGDKNPANLMYFGVPVVGIIGAIVARFRPRGMARALFATALAQALVPVIALMIWNPRVVSWAPGVLTVFCLNTFFVALFAGSAFLFRRASAHRL